MRQVLNYGNHRRDFTYIDNIVEGVVQVLNVNAAANKAWSGMTPDASSSKVLWKVYNIACSNPVGLLLGIKSITTYKNKVSA